MAQDSQPPAYSTDMANDLPPSYVEAVEGVQLSPRQEMTQVMIDPLQNHMDDTAEPEKQNKNWTWLTILIVVIINIIIISCIFI